MYERDKVSRVGINNTTDAVDVTESRELLEVHFSFILFACLVPTDTLRLIGIDKRKLSFVVKTL